MPEEAGTAEPSAAAARGVDVATLGAIFLTLFVFLKAYGAARFSLTTASALLSDAPLSVLLGTLISYAYALLPLLSLGSLCWLAVQDYSVATSNHQWRVAAFVLAVVTGALSPWAFLWPWLPGLFLLVALDLLARRRRRSAPDTSPPRPTRPWQRWARFVPPLGRMFMYYFPSPPRSCSS